MKERNRNLWNMLVSRSNMKSGVILNIHFLDFKTKQYPELLSVEVLRAEGRQAEEEGN